MADNIAVTEGSGKTVATDDVGGVQYQRIKIDGGADGAAAPITGDTANGLDVDVTRLPALPAGNNNIGDVDVASQPARDAATDDITIYVQFDDESPATASENGLRAARGTATGDVHVNLRANDGSEIGTASAPVRTDPTGSTAQPVTDNGGSLTVDGTVAATQSGTWNITNISGTVSLPTGAATAANQATANTSLSSIDGKLVTAKTADFDTGGGTDTVQMLGIALPKSGGAVAGGTSTDPIRTDPTGTTAQPITDNGGSLTVDGTVTVQDGGGSLTVDGTVAATQSGTWNITNVSGTVSLPTGAATEAKQDTGNTSLSAINTDTTAIAAAIKTEDAAHASGDKGVMPLAVRKDARGTISGADGDYTPLQVNADGDLRVDGSAVTQPISAASLPLPTGASTAANQSTGNTSLAAINTDTTAIKTAVEIMDDWDESDRAKVNPIVGQAGVQGNSGVVTATTQRVVLATDVALPAGTNAIGKLAANSGVVIGSVEIAASQTLATVTSVTQNADVRQSTASNLNAQVVGSIAHDTADSGNPVKVGAKAIASLKTTTLVAGADRTDAQSDLDGVILVRNSTPLGDVISERVTNTDGASTAFSNFSAVAGTKNYIRGYSVYNSSGTAGHLDFRDGTGGAILWTVPLPAGGGANVIIDEPIFKTSANTALAYDVSAALSTVYISVTGFQSKL